MTRASHRESLRTRVQNGIAKITPPGHLSLSEWCRRNGVRPETASRWIKTGRVGSIKIGQYHFVPETLTPLADGRTVRRTVVCKP